MNRADNPAELASIIVAGWVADVLRAPTWPAPGVAEREEAESEARFLAKMESLRNA